MESQTNERQQNIHRRVQQRIAGNILDHVDPDRAFVNEFHSDRLGQFREVDSDTKKKFEKQHNKFRKIESAYSIQNICWLIASIGVFYYTDFYRAVLYDPRVNRLWFNIGAVLIGVNIVIGLFLVIYLSFIKKISSDEWDILYPAAIPTATGAFVLGGIFLTFGLWPIWGPLSAVILAVFFMGFVVLIAMLPNF